MSTLRLLLSLLILLQTSEVWAQKDKAGAFDSTAYSVKSETINGKKFFGWLKSSGFYLFDSKDKLIVHSSGDYFDWKLKDFNGDGKMDIFLDKGGNTPEWYDIFLFVSTNHYQKIKDANLFPDPVNIPGTNYYYSYHKSGCADKFWASDLFYISDYRAIRIGNIWGNECGEDDGVKLGVYINKVRGNKKTHVITFPVQILKKYTDLKWGFIKNYWLENYKLFV